MQITLLLEVENLNASFGHAGSRMLAVDAVSFSLASGEAVGLVGESGCGKSTLARALIRLGDADIGGNGSGPARVSFEGIDVLRADAAQLQRIRGGRIGMVFQEPLNALDPLFCVGQQIAEVLRVHRGLSWRSAEQEALKLMRLVQLPAAESRYGAYPHELSGGLRQRVMIAIALAAKPSLLIADEPTTALDVTVQAQILALLQHLQAVMGMALLLVTHDLGVVFQVCTRVLVMYAGQIVEAGPVNEVFTEPLHPYTRALIEALPTLATTKTKPLATIPGQVPRLDERQCGCAFSNRCQQVKEICWQKRPQMQSITAKRSVACWLSQPARVTHLRCGVDDG